MSTLLIKGSLYLAGKLKSSGRSDGVASPQDFLCHFDGANNSTSFIDVHGHTINSAGGVVLKTAQAKFGPSAGFFAGSVSAHLQTNSEADFAFGNSAVNWTIEGWVYPTELPGGSGALADACVFDFRYSSPPEEGLAIYSHLASGGGAGLSTGWGLANGSIGLITGSILPLNTWTFLTLCRVGNTLNGYKNGVLDFTMTYVKDFGTNHRFTIGSNLLTTQWFIGYMDEWRVTFGTARYLSNFTPPTSQFPNS